MQKWTLVTITCIGIIAIVVWLFSGISGLLSAERDLLQRLDDLSKYYASMDKDYVQPLVTSSYLSEGDKAALSAVSSQLQKLGAAKNANEQFENLLLAQKLTMSFFAPTGLPEEFLSDTRFQNWNKNSTNTGEASKLVYDYNVALSLYNARLLSTAGKIAGYFHTIEHRSYIGIDGTLQEHTKVSF